jgi:hypothetical protein
MLCLFFYVQTMGNTNTLLPIPFQSLQFLGSRYEKKTLPIISLSSFAAWRLDANGRYRVSCERRNWTNECVFGHRGALKRWA